jgi:hypothetical protein
MLLKLRAQTVRFLATVVACATGETRRVRLAKLVTPRLDLSAVIRLDTQAGHLAKLIAQARRNSSHGAWQIRRSFMAEFIAWFAEPQPFVMFVKNERGQEFVARYEFVGLATLGPLQIQPIMVSITPLEWSKKHS